MGTCTLNQNISNFQVIAHQDEIANDDHMVSSRMVIQKSHKLFDQSDALETKESNAKTFKFNNSSLSPQVSLTDPLKNVQDQKLPLHKKLKETTQKTKAKVSFNLSYKQNALSNQKIQGKRKRTIVMGGNFLKIKQKQACSEYKVMAKIANKTGEMYKVQDKTTSQTRSLQIIKQDKSSTQTLHEINLLKRLDHPNIYHLYDVFLKKGFYYVIGQYIEGDNIWCLTKQNQVMTEKKLSKLIRQIFQALNYLHYRGIMHRNIKPETIVFEFKLTKNQPNLPAIKLINFKKASEIQMVKGQIGSYHFMAPQMITGSHNQKCDVWSVGIILYLLVSGQLPFKGDTKEEVQRNVVAKDLTFKEKIWETKSESLKQLLKELLHKSPMKRISAQQALTHAWFKEASDSVKILMSKSTMKNLLCTGFDSKFKTIIKTYLVKMTTSMQQRQDMARKFQSIDTDRSGFIDKTQLIAAYKQIHGSEMSKSVNLDDIIEKIDINKSGLIDFSEFMASISKVETLFARDRLQKAFDFIDNDGTGEIQISELMELLNNEIENEDRTEEDQQIADILKEFDHDGNKTISKEEFIDFFLKLNESNRIKTESKIKVDMTL